MSSHAFFRRRISATCAAVATAAGLFAYAVGATAATISVTPADVAVAPGGMFTAQVILDGGDDALNAVEGALRFPSDLLTLEAVREGGIITLWTDRPACKGCEDGVGNLPFGGIMPGGYRGNDGRVFTAVFSAKKEGTAKVTVADARALRDDGRGKAVPLSFRPMTVRIASGAAQGEVSVTDAVPPEPFVPLLSHGSPLFDGGWFLAFEAADKDSGIDRYDLAYGDTSVPPSDPSAWTPAESPAPIDAARLRGYLFVRATDRAGNVTVATVPPQRHPWRWQVIAAILASFAVVSCVSTYLCLILKKRHKTSVR